MFPAKIGNVAKPCRMVLGSLILQSRMGFTDRELVNQITQNPYYQYFIGLEAFRHEAPFVPSLLVDWRKRIDLQFVIRANDLLCDAVPKLGRPSNDERVLKKDKRITARDQSDRIEIERYFSTAKRRNGMGLIMRKREDTSLTTIAMSVLVTNIFGSFKLAVDEMDSHAETKSKTGSATAVC